MPPPVAKLSVYSVVPSEGAFTVHRDGFPFKTPAGGVLATPTAVLAEAIALELRTQTGKPDPAKLPFLVLASTALDIVTKKREAAIDRIATYAEGDLLCHRADEPPDFAEKQQQIWQPLLDWCAKTFDAPLRTASGIMPIAQPTESRAALRRAVEKYDNFWLAGLSEAAGVSGSLVLALALAERHITGEQAFAAAELDATHQMEKWGEDPAVKARHEEIKCDLAICEKWFGLL